MLLLLRRLLVGLRLGVFLSALLWLAISARPNPLDNEKTHHPRKPVESTSSRHVYNDIDPDDTEVPPPVAVLDSKVVEEDVGVCQLAELAVGSSRRVVQATTGVGLVSLQVVAAGLSGGWVELLEFFRTARDGRVGDGDTEDTFDKVGEGRDAVHELPEPGEGVVGYENTAD